MLSADKYKKITGMDPGLNQKYVIVDSLTGTDADSEESAKFYAHPEKYYLYFTGKNVAEVLDDATFLEIGRAHV